MEAILTFAIGRLLYSLIEGKVKFRYLILELAFTIVFFATSVFLMTMANIEARSVAIGIAFVVTGIATRLLHRKPPVEARGKSVAIGIIDFVWLAIMGAALAIVSFGRSVSPFADQLPQTGLRPEYYRASYDTVQFLLGWVLNTVPILGATLGGCMAILWAGELWNKEGNDANVKYSASTIAAIKMVIAFFVVIFGVFFWLGIPLYYRLVGLGDLLKR